MPHERKIFGSRSLKQYVAVLLALLLAFQPIASFTDSSALTPRNSSMVSNNIYDNASQPLAAASATDESQIITDENEDSTTEGDNEADETGLEEQDGSQLNASSIIVKLKYKPGLRAAAIAGKAEQSLQVVKLNQGEDLNAALDEIKGNPDVEYAEPNYELFAQADPDDPEYAEQWSISEAEIDKGWDTAVDILGAAASALPVEVAVIDTGIDMEHEDLMDRIQDGYNAITGANENDYADDSKNGHGTHVAGIIAATGNNGIGICGGAGAFPISILPVKVLDSAGVGTMYDIAQGIKWAVDNGAEVINLSLGARLPDFPVTLAEAVEYAQSNGVVVVAAAGNEYGKYVEGFYPACLPGVISVSATNQEHYVADFSNESATVNAPGVDIFSTLPGNEYGAMSGTSMSAALVSSMVGVILSTMPDSKISEIRSAINQGQIDFPEGSGYYATHHYVASLDWTLYKLDNGKVDNWTDIRFTEPDDDAHVSGIVKLAVEVNAPEKIDSIEIDLYPNGSAEKTIVGTIDNLDTQNNIFSVEWDSTTVPDGSYEFAIVSTLKGSTEVYHNDYLDVIVNNNESSGLSVTVKKPDGTAAAKAQVSIYHLEEVSEYSEDYVYYEYVGEYSADMQGRVSVPGTEATDGNDYLIVAYGCQPNFVYYQIVRGPAQITLDAADCETVEVTGNKINGEPLGGATILVDWLTTSLDETGWSEVRGVYQEPIANLDASGSAEITMTKGMYNLRLLSTEDYYYLVKKDVKVDGSGGEVSFETEANEAATLNFMPHRDFSSISVMMWEADTWFQMGFGNIDITKPLIVSPGTYSSEIKTLYDDTVQWLWVLETPELELIDDEAKTIDFGGEINGDLYADPQSDMKYKRNSAAYFYPKYDDGYGNTVVNLANRNYTPSSSSATSILYDTFAAKPEKPEDEKSGSQSFILDQDTNGFVPLGSTFYDVRPGLHIFDSSMNEVNIQPYYLLLSSYQFAFWSIASTQAIGKYYVQQILSSTPFNPEANDGVIESTKLELEVVETPPTPETEPDLTLNVLDWAGKPMVNAKVQLFEKAEEGLEPVYIDWDNLYTYTDNKGVARYWYTELMPDADYIAFVYGQTEIKGLPLKPKEPMLYTADFKGGAAPMTVTIDPSNYDMKKIELHCQDSLGAELIRTRVSYGIFKYIDGIPIGIDVDTKGNEYSDTPTSLSLWITAGSYMVKGNVEPLQYWPSSNEAQPIYRLSKNISIDSNTTDSEIFTMGGTDMAKVEISPSADNVADASNYSVPAAALFLQSLKDQSAYDLNQRETQILYIRPGQSIYVTPGEYRIEAALQRKHFDGNWDYCFDKEVDLAVNLPDKTWSWQLSDKLTAGITMSSSSYGLKDIAGSRHAITDKYGNQLTAMGIGMNLNANPYEESSVDTSVSEQNHQEIAPFLTIIDPNGGEVLHYKDAGWAYDDFQNWDREYSDDDAVIAQLIDKHNTFFEGSYQIPENAFGGIYTAKLELGAGPEGVISGSTAFEVSAAPAAPQLQSLPQYTKSSKLLIKGTTVPEAEVTVEYKLDDGAATLGGSVNAGTDGGFELELLLNNVGRYIITCFATKDGLKGNSTSPVTVIVDRTAPASPTGLTGDAQDDSHILMSWTAPSDTDLNGYWVFRDGSKIAETGSNNSSYIDEGLQTGKEYSYEVVAVDYAGNTSMPASVKVTIDAATHDALKPTVPTNLKAVQKPGGIVELTWNASADNIKVTGYKLWRGIGQDEKIFLADVDALSYKDTGLLASTSYSYAVTACDAAGNQSGYSETAAANTPDLTIQNTTWRASRIFPNGPAAMGSSVNLNVTGEPNRLAEVIVDYMYWLNDIGNVLAQPRSMQVAVQLTESKDAAGSGSGIYTGSFKLIQGIASIIKLESKISDSGNHAVTKVFPMAKALEVSGGLKVTIEGEAGVKFGSQMTVWSGKVGSGAQKAVDTPGEYLLDKLAAADDYNIKLMQEGTLELYKAAGVEVKAGLVKAVSAAPKYPAKLSIKVLDVDGSALSNTFVYVADITDAANSKYLGTLITDSSGQTPLITKLLKDSKIKATVYAPLNKSQGPIYKQKTELEQVLAGGINNMELELQEYQKGTLKGTVTKLTGDAIPNAEITVTQMDSSNRLLSRRCKTDSNGRYSIELISGHEASVSVASPTPEVVGLFDQKVDIEAGEATVLDMTLLPQTERTLKVNIHTKYAGDSVWRDPIEMDWRVAVHFRMEVSVPQGGSIYTYWNYPVKFKALAGEKITVSVDGVEANLPSASQEITLGEEMEVVADLYLQQKGAINGELQKLSGSEINYWNGQIYKIDNSDSLVPVKSFYGSGKYFETSLPEGGNYRLTFTNYEDGLYYGTKDITIQEGESLDISTVTLQEQGCFTDINNNRLTAVPGEVTPGGVLNLRVSYKASSAAKDAVALLEVPKGASMVEQSITLNGVQKAAENNGGIFELALGDLSAGASGVICYQVKVDGDIAEDAVSAACRIKYDIAGEEHEEEVGSAAASVIRVSINSPVSIVKLDTIASGRAPAGTIVEVYDDDVLLGEVQASPGGYWSLPVTLPDRGSTFSHRLSAQAQVAGTTCKSPVAFVKHDPTLSMLTQFTMQQTDGRSISFDPTMGNAMFPYVVVPGSSFEVKTEFSNPQNVKDVSVAIGKSNGAAHANGSSSSIPWTYDLGPIYASYKVKASPSTFNVSVPSESKFREQTPKNINNFEITSVQQATPENPTGMVECTIPQGQIKKVSVTYTATEIQNYTPSAADLVKASDTGVSMYEFYLSDPSIEGTHLIINVSGKIPKADVVEEKSDRISAAAAGSVIDVVVKVDLDAGTVLNAADWASTLKDGVGVPDKFKELGDLLDQAINSCSPTAASGYKNRIDKAANKLMGGEATKWGLQLAGVFLGPETFGLGTLALFGVSKFTEWYIDTAVDNEIKKIKDDMSQDSECEKFKDKKDKIADPKWIWDPSGYVYEVTPDNRLEDVTATALYKDDETADWKVWDADWYGQQNPMETDIQGKYGWDVPAGEWKVSYQKDGYQTTESDTMTVPPPRTEVNISMYSNAVPTVTAVAAAAKGKYVDVTFDKYMKVSTLTESTIGVAPFEAQEDWLSGTITPVSPVNDPKDNTVTLASTMRFTPLTDLEIGKDYMVTVSNMVQSYSGQLMQADASSKVTIQNEVQPVGEVQNLSAEEQTNSIRLSWDDPESANLNKIKVYWRVDGSADYTNSAEVQKGVEHYTITGLSSGTDYEIKVTTIDMTGVESGGLTQIASTTVPEEPDEHERPSRGSTAKATVLPPNPNIATAAFGPEAKHFAAFDDQLQLDFSAGTYEDRVELTLKKLVNEAFRDGNNLTGFSPVFELVNQADAFKKLVTISIKYDKTKLDATKPMKLGIYRQDDRDPSKWVYVGGTVDLTSGMVSADIKQYGKYVVALYDKQFIDMGSHWSKPQVDALVSRHIAEGLSESEFQPDMPISREALVMMMVKALASAPGSKINMMAPHEPTFTDVQPDSIYYTYIETAAYYGLAKGSGTTFGPKDTVTREQLATMMTRMLASEKEIGNLNGITAPYSDSEQISAWAYNNVIMAYQRNLMNGVGNNMFQPTAPTTRAQACTIIYRVMEQLGILETPETILGALTLSSVEGGAYVLKNCATGKDYTLIPPNDYIRAQLLQWVGKETNVTGVVTDNASSYMTGITVKLISVGGNPPLPGG